MPSHTTTLNDAEANGQVDLDTIGMQTPGVIGTSMCTKLNQH